VLGFEVLERYQYMKIILVIDICMFSDIV
jgi:hypothetical protein